MIVEVAGTCRWLFKLIEPLGPLLLAHPQNLRSLVQRRGKLNKIDAQLLRIDQIPLAHYPPDEYQLLHDVTRQRARLGRELAGTKTSVRAVAARYNIVPIYKSPFGPRGLYWFPKQDLGYADKAFRNELLDRFRHFETQILPAETRMKELQPRYPQMEVLTSLYGIGLYSALAIVGELSDVERFREAKQIAAYAALTARVHQSGDPCYRGHISKQGSP